MNDTPVKRGPGRPRKNPLPVADREPLREPVKTDKFKMRAQPNWVDVDPSANPNGDRLHVDLSAIPPELSVQWVTDSVYGQPMPQDRSRFEQGGWTPVSGDDFDGKLDGVYMKKGSTEEINVGGQVLMARPKAMTDKARIAELRQAREQVLIKEKALTGGDLNTTLDSRHPSAVNSNRINKSVERLEIPE